MFQKLKDPGSAITHGIAMLSAVSAASPLLVKALRGPNQEHALSLAVFILSMILLYGASTLYHSLNLSAKGNLILKKLDHAMIFILIAGSYTPVCVIVIKGVLGYGMLALIWGIALIGIILKMCYINCPHWLSSLIYISMGWTCVLAFSPIINNLPRPAFFLLLAGGIIYTVGGIIYALKLPIFNQLHKNFGSHEIFHLFVMGGSFCHYLMAYLYLA
ncbi:MAG: hemolysin III family protein [Lachnospiraceae bacterium]|nr:hemolysin III family protein [Lachnospiraceae bacterium]